MSEVFDLAVIGGGPSGASAAITAAQLGFRVLLLEAGVFPRHKVCGEFVSAEASSILQGLVNDNVLFANAPRISKAKLFLDGAVAELPVNPAALSLSRYELDLTLWLKAIDVGVCARERTAVKDVSRSQEYFLLNAEGYQGRAHVVIDASGRWSRLRAGKFVSSEHWIGLKGHFREEADIDSCDLYFFAGGYCGVQPLGDGRVNAAAMVRTDVARSLAGVCTKNRALEVRSRNWTAITEPVSTAPLFFALPRTSDREMALVGDAAAFIDPFAGDGISIALHTGRMAALALSRHLRGECSLMSALHAYDCEYHDLVQPALKNAARFRRILQFPRALRLSAMSLLKLPMMARVAVQQTRVRKAS